MDAISDVALSGAGGIVADGIIGGIVNAGKYGYSQAQQGAGGDLVNVPVLSRQNTNTPVKSGTAAGMLDKAEGLRR